VVVVGDDSATVERRAPSIASLIAGAEAPLAAAVAGTPRAIPSALARIDPGRLAEMDPAGDLDQRAG
jgi:hypothetical protein